MGMGIRVKLFWSQGRHLACTCVRRRAPFQFAQGSVVSSRYSNYIKRKVYSRSKALVPTSPHGLLASLCVLNLGEFLVT